MCGVLSPFAVVVQCTAVYSLLYALPARWERAGGECAAALVSLALLQRLHECCLARPCRKNIEHVRQNMSFCVCVVGCDEGVARSGQYMDWQHGAWP